MDGSDDFLTPPKINMELQNGDLEDVFSSSMGWFLGSMLIFRGVFQMGDFYVKHEPHPPL